VPLEYRVQQDPKEPLVCKEPLEPLGYKVQQALKVQLDPLGVTVPLVYKVQPAYKVPLALMVQQVLQVQQERELQAQQVFLDLQVQPVLKVILLACLNTLLILQQQVAE
jgi:hypothetical protein